MQELIVYGAGGFAREVKDVIDALEATGAPVRCVGFLDDAAGSHGKVLNETPVLGGISLVDQRKTGAKFVVGIGAPQTKKRVAEKIAGHGGAFQTLIHPRATHSRFVTFGEGTIVTAGVILTNHIQVGRHVILNLNTTVGHDCIIEDYVTISPGAHISGDVVIGEGTDVGTGASIIQGIRIGKWCVIGAGAVVNKDLPDNCTAVGVPAKVIKTRDPGWHEHG